MNFVLSLGCTLVQFTFAAIQHGGDDLIHVVILVLTQASAEDDLRLGIGQLLVLGTLEYRSVRFENELLDKPSFQGNAAVNYTDRETPWTRIIEHKWFEFGKDENGNDLPKTIISREYSSEWKPGDEPYYPVNDAKNGALYAEYKKLADAEPKVIFGSS